MMSMLKKTSANVPGMSQEIALDDRIRKMVLQKKNLKKLKKKIVDS